GEVSGHFYFKNSSFLEAIDYTALLVIKIWRESGKKFSELLDPFTQYANSGEINRKVADKEEVLRRFKELYIGKADVVDETDGLRCEFSDQWWFIIRPSNTEPIMRLTIEAVNDQLLKEKVSELSELLY
ncbi:phosphomannomutase/phosphoglucomutase, partial [Candidatus Parcubacteria bacterium]